MNTQPVTARRNKPPLSLKMQGKQPAKAPVKLAQPVPKRPPLPRGESKMAIDFYVASMLESQVRQLMTEPDGMIHLNRVPSPYRKILVPSPAPQAREGVAYFEAELDDADEMTMSFFEATLDAFDSWASYLWSWLPAWPPFRWPFVKKEAEGLPQFTQPQARCDTPTYVIDERPDTPGSQGTPQPRGNSHDQSSYFSLE